MSGPLIVMCIIGTTLIIVSFFVSEKLSQKEKNFNIDLLTVNEDYTFSERELSIIKRKIEDVIARQAKDILYETNESLSNMSNEKMMALGDYAVSVCDQIEKNHKEVMFLYSMLDDKQKEIMKTVHTVAEADEKAKNSADYLEELINKQTEKIKHLTIIEDAKITMEEPLNKEEEPEIEKALTEEAVEIPTDSPSLEEDTEETTSSESGINQKILEMYQKGESIIGIAKQLGLGVGEVKLIVDLYQGE